MSNRLLTRRLWTTAILLVGATILLHASSRQAKIPIRRPLKNLPLSLGDWSGEELPLTEHIVAALNVDDFLNRTYTNRGGDRIEVYVGYYESQRRGELIHSPKNCLPASGWEWVRKDRRTVQMPNHEPITINDFRIVKGLSQDLVLYWYQGRGRAIADEYEAKLWMVADAMTHHRTDGSLVRLVIPIQDSEARARAAGVQFLQAFYPHLTEFVPD